MNILPQILRFSYNPKGINKEWDYKELTTGYIDTEGSPQDLERIVCKGWAINGGQFNSKPRSRANVVHNGLLCLDFDNTLMVNGEKTYNPQMTWEMAQANPFLQKYAIMAYTSPSYRDEWHKLRVVIPLPDGIDNDTYTMLIKWVMEQVPGCDPACKDPGRVFFGNNKAKVHHYNPTAKISPEIIAQCKQQARLEQERISQERVKQLKWLESQNPEENKKLALEALRVIPGRGQKGDGRYPECLTVAFACCDIFGYEALSVIESWSPTDPRNNWNPEKIVRDYNGGVKGGSLFYIAQYYGFSFPDREKWVDPRDPSGPEYEEYERYLEQEEFTDNAIAKEKKQNRFQRWLDNAFKPKERKNHARPKVRTENILRLKDGKDFPTKEEWAALGKPKIMFTGGASRAAHLNRAVELGYTNIFENSFMGLGKSHSVPDIANPDGTVYYVSQDHRNPTINRIKNEFTDMIPRTKYGFTYDAKGRLVKATEDTDYCDLVIKPNCHRADLFQTVHTTGHQIFTDGELNPICGTCTQLKQCRAKGFLNDRARRAKNKKLRCDINGLDRFADYRAAIFVVDELKSLNPSKVISTTYAQLLIELDRLRDLLHPDIYSYLDKVVYGAKGKFRLPQGKYGLTTEEIKRGLPTHPYLKEIIDFLENAAIDLSPYFEEADGIVTGDKKLKGAARLANQFLGEEANKEALEKLADMPPNALLYILKMIAGEPVQARLRYDFNKKDNYLNLIADNRFYTPIFNSAKSMILLDGTASIEKVRLVTGIEDWLVIEEEIKFPLANLEIRFIKTQGLGSNNLSEVALARVACLLETLDPKGKLGFKKHLKDLQLDGYWFKHNIGSNEFEGMEQLAFVGTPFSNLGAVKDEFLALGGKEQDFDYYYQGLTEEQILQACGRQRCSRYPDQKFHIDWIGSEERLGCLSQYGVKVTTVEAFEIDPRAGTTNQVIMAKYIQVSIDAVKEGAKVTQQAIAYKLLETKEAIGHCQSTISENLKRAGVTAKDLLELARLVIGSPNGGKYTPADILALPEYRAVIGLDPLVELAETIAAIATMSWQDVKDLILDFKDVPLQFLSVMILLESLEVGTRILHSNTT